MLPVADGLLVPAIMIAALGFAVPRLLARLLPEGVRPLMLNAFLSTLILFILSAGFFMLLYAGQGAGLSELLSLGAVSNIFYFGKLGLAAALIWAPIMVLSVAGLPRKWVKETW
ncbi:hypothetical protein [Yoonia sp. BS5-3]|uniref:Uncharacterized protein n=1 Tax=Yoonia phaeophyticola TaxID=3137369 RepID=A0ABZ2V7D1_9RHOB